MKRKEDLTMTNKQMLVAQLRKEQEQNRILRIELEEAKRENKAEIERLKAENETYCKQINQAYDTGYNDGYDSCQDDIKRAKIDVLTELKKKYGFYICCSWYRATKLLGKIIDEFIEEIKNEQDTSNDTARGGDRSMAKK